ncbi:MAG TPA: ElyC/SanA/YdcF family protein [Candidatus Saccharimonadales bacterium]|jgi:hypothetical protein
MNTYDIMPGTPGLSIDEIAHVIIPGRGRDESGNGLSEHSIARAKHSAEFYNDHKLERKMGYLVCTGYKTPAENKGVAWSPEDTPDEVYVGVPEADSIKQVLLSQKVNPARIAVERRSIDTVTNFTFSEDGGYFGPNDARPVAIVAQLAHLERMIDVIAPKTLRRDYLGIIVPEDGEPETDSIPYAKLISKILLTGINPYKKDAAQITARRAVKAWHIANSIRSFSPHNK